MNQNNYLDELIHTYDDTFQYELDNRLILNWYPRRILLHAKGNHLLELGVGHGYCSLVLSNHFKRHVIVEGSREIITKFKSKRGAERIEIVHSYFEEYVTEEKFDVILMGFVMEHVSDPHLILQRFRRYLNTDGSIFITVPNAHALNKRFGYEAGMLKTYDSLSEADLALGHRRLFTVDSLRSLVEEEDLIVQRMEGLFLKPITTDQILRLGLSEEILQAMLQVGIDYPELCVGILIEAKVRV